MTPPDVEAYLARVTTTVRVVVGANLVGVCTVGSLALDGYVPGRSDIDVLVIAKDTTPRAVWPELAARLDHRTLPCPATGLELSVIPQRAAASGSTKAAFVLALSSGTQLPDTLLLDPSGQPRFWWVIDRSIARQSGVALHGPPPAQLIGAVSREQLLPILVESLDHQLANQADLADSVILNGARSWHFAARDRWVSKRAAGAWAQTRSTHPALIELALHTHSQTRETAAQIPVEEARSFLVEARAAVSAARHS